MSNFIREFEEDEEEEEEEEMLPNSTLPPSSKGAFTTKNDGDNDSKLNSTVFKKKRNHPGNPDPDAEVIALSPRTLMATNRYICEVCLKGFKRDQNLQLHRRGHNLPWKLKQRPNTEVKKRVYICPVLTCIHREPSRALGDLTGIKKHFCRKHGEKKWKCDKCSKRYAVQSDWKAHSKICGTREYRCDCGTLFSRKDSFVTHRAFCDALAEENNRVNQSLGHAMGATFQSQSPESFSSSMPVTSSFASATALSISNQQPLFLNSSAGLTFSSCNSDANFNPNAARATLSGFSSSSVSRNANIAMSYPSMSATALLQKAAEMGSKISDNEISPILLRGFTGYSCSTMNSQGSVAQEASATVNHNMALTNGLHLDQNAFEKQWEPDSAVVQGGFFNSPMENGVTHDNSLGMLVSGNERTTVDFLGVGPGGQLGIGEERGCDGHTIGLSYSERQQTLHSGWLSHRG